MVQDEGLVFFANAIISYRDFDTNGSINGVIKRLNYLGLQWYTGEVMTDSGTKSKHELRKVKARESDSTKQFQFSSAENEGRRL